MGLDIIRYDMLSKAIIKDIQSLQQKKHRMETGRFVAEGPKLVRELLLSRRFELLALYATENWSGWNILDDLNVSCDLCLQIPDHLLERIAQYNTPNEVVAVFKQDQSISLPGEISGNIILALDQIQDPGNLGTIIRSADWFGVKHVVCSADTTDCYAPKVVQSTMASIANVQVHYTNLESWLKSINSSLPVWTTDMHGKSPSNVLAGRKEGILVIGNEGHGVSDRLHSLATEKIAIPGMGKAESLNAAVAASILLYAVRQ
jgi:TrmH family RNA methyltransferase